VISKKELELYGAGKTILFIDGDGILRELFQHSFSKYVKKILVASDGVDGIETYKKNKDIDIVVTEINLSIKNGLQVTKEIKRINENQQIIVLSSEDNTNIYLPLFEIGINSFIHKPFMFDKIAEKILPIFENQYFKNIILDLETNNKRKNEKAQQKLEEHSTVIKQESKSINQQTKVTTSLDNCNVKSAKDLFLFFKTNTNKKHNHKINVAIKLLIKNNYTLREEQDELTDINFNDELSPSEQDNIIFILENISNIFATFHLALNELLIFEALSETFFDFHLLFLSYTTITTLNMKEIEVLANIEFLLEDMQSCIDTIFVSKTCENIFIYDKMLKDSLKHIENSISECQKDTENDIQVDGELDFF
jgi:DNA-binding response OmpR family regulator